MNAAESACRTLTFTRLADPVVDDVGQHVASRYCETWWLPVLGPSAMWLLRHVAYHLEHGDGRYVVGADVLSRSLGLGATVAGKSAPLMRTLDRLVTFDAADGGWADEWRMRTVLPVLAARQLRRFPDALRVAHDELLAGSRS